MKRASAPGYDRFKTIVTAILAVILILMLLRECAINPASPAPTQVPAVENSTETLAPTVGSTETSVVAEATQTLTSSPAPTAIEPTATPTTATLTATPEAAVPEATNTAVGEVTATAPVDSTPTPAQNVACDTSAPSRLSVGQSARVLRRLNMRSEASIEAPIIQTNPTNTQVEIIGGPQCTPVGDSAYLWWQIRLPNGSEGWSAETLLNEASYFLEPIP